MSVLIKGMDMPVEGLVTVNIHSDGTVYVYGAYPTELHEAVPVPTPHGRLIDADEVPYFASSPWKAIATQSEIEKMPTIIEAEVGE